MTYERWSKQCSQARFSLTSSGVLDYPLAELPPDFDDAEKDAGSGGGYPPLVRRLAQKTGAPAECVVHTIGASMANFVAMAALIHRGDEVLIEHPTYEPLPAIAQWLGAKVRRLERRADKGFKLGLGEVERQVTPQT